MPTTPFTQMGLTIVRSAFGEGSNAKVFGEYLHSHMDENAVTALRTLCSARDDVCRNLIQNFIHYLSAELANSEDEASNRSQAVREACKALASVPPADLQPYQDGLKTVVHSMEHPVWAREAASMLLGPLYSLEELTGRLGSRHVSPSHNIGRAMLLQYHMESDALLDTRVLPHTIDELLGLTHHAIVGEDPVAAPPPQEGFRSSILLYPGRPATPQVANCPSLDTKDATRHAPPSAPTSLALLFPGTDVPNTVSLERQHEACPLNVSRLLRSVLSTLCTITERCQTSMIQYLLPAAGQALAVLCWDALKLRVEEEEVEAPPDLPKPSQQEKEAAETRRVAAQLLAKICKLSGRESAGGEGAGVRTAACSWLWMEGDEGVPLFIPKNNNYIVSLWKQAVVSGALRAMLSDADKLVTMRSCEALGTLLTTAAAMARGIDVVEDLPGVADDTHVASITLWTSSMQDGALLKSLTTLLSTRGDWDTPIATLSALVDLYEVLQLSNDTIQAAEDDCLAFLLQAHTPSLTTIVKLCKHRGCSTGFHDGLSECLSSAIEDMLDVHKLSDCSAQAAVAGMSCAVVLIKTYTLALSLEVGAFEGFLSSLKEIADSSLSPAVRSHAAYLLISVVGGASLVRYDTSREACDWLAILIEDKATRWGVVEGLATWLPRDLAPDTARCLMAGLTALLQEGCTNPPETTADFLTQRNTIERLTKSRTSVVKCMRAVVRRFKGCIESVVLRRATKSVVPFMHGKSKLCGDALRLCCELLSACREGSKHSLSQYVCVMTFPRVTEMLREGVCPQELEEYFAGLSKEASQGTAYDRTALFNVCMVTLGGVVEVPRIARKLAATDASQPTSWTNSMSAPEMSYENIADEAIWRDYVEENLAITAKAARPRPAHVLECVGMCVNTVLKEEKSHEIDFIMSQLAVWAGDPHMYLPASTALAVSGVRERASFDSVDALQAMTEGVTEVDVKERCERGLVMGIAAIDLHEEAELLSVCQNNMGNPEVLGKAALHAPQLLFESVLRQFGRVTTPEAHLRFAEVLSYITRHAAHSVSDTLIYHVSVSLKTLLKIGSSGVKKRVLMILEQDLPQAGGRYIFGVVLCCWEVLTDLQNTRAAHTAHQTHAPPAGHQYDKDIEAEMKKIFGDSDSDSQSDAPDEDVTTAVLRTKKTLQGLEINLEGGRWIGTGTVGKLM